MRFGTLIMSRKAEEESGVLIRDFPKKEVDFNLGWSIIYIQLCGLRFFFGAYDILLNCSLK